ncbi:MAG: CCA tRNA nucleotidyltransferase [Candidatus Bathyarchaeia archaeon]
MLIDKILADAFKLVKPDRLEEARIESLSSVVLSKVRGLLAFEGVDAEAEILGSVAKGTWLRGDCDIDVFILYPPHIDRRLLTDLSIRIGVKAFEDLGGRWILRYAEHPYVEGWVEGVRVNIVPACRSKPGSWVTAVDRTPYHTDYVRRRIPSEEGRDQVRLLKKFMKGIGVYGADVRVGGFSGYLCELLITKFGSFIETVKSAARGWRGLFIDLEGYYGSVEAARKVFGDQPFIVVDPVDPYRNVASPVSLTKLSEFTAASRLFLDKPSIDFFNPPPVRFDADLIREAIERRGTSLLALSFEEPDIPPDTLWGEIYRSLKAFVNIFERWEFKVIRSTAWSGDELTIFVVELESKVIPGVKLHRGPPVDSLEASIFLEKYLAEGGGVFGPWIDGDRWYVARRRSYTDAYTLAMDLLRGDLSAYGFSKDIASSISKGFKIYMNGELLGLVERCRGFSEYLYEFLDGRPRWLRLGLSKDTCG